MRVISPPSFQRQAFVPAWRLRLPVSRRFGLVLVLVLSGVFFPGRATAPTPPVRIELPEPDQVLSQVDERLAIEFSALVEADVESAEVIVTLRRAGEEERDGQRSAIFREAWQPQRDRRMRFRAELPLPGPGHYEVDIRLRGQTDSDNGFSDRKFRRLIVGEQRDARLITDKQWVREARRQREDAFQSALRKSPDRPDIRLLSPPTRAVPSNTVTRVKPWFVPPERRLTVRPAELSEGLRRYSVDHVATSWTSIDPITVRGRLVYRDYDGAWRPLVNVSVNLWDEDWDWDEHLGVTVTDWNGDWSFSVNNNDGWGADGRDLYYTFKLANTRIRVEDCDGIDSTYRWGSDVRENLADGSVVDYGTQTGVSNAGAMQIWGHLNLAWNHAASVGGQDPGFVDSCFPEEDKTHWDRFWEELDIQSEYTDGPDVVTHEYGHAVMWYAYDDDNPSPGGAHSFSDCVQNQSLAWSEGWATAFMLSVRPDGIFNWHEGDGGQSIENFSNGCRTGESHEGRVAAALNDLLDAADDTNGGAEDRGRNSYGDANASARVPFSAMLRDTLWGGWHNNVLEFWSSLAGELNSAQRSGGQRIMYYNWMSVAEPGGCAASRITAGEAPRSDALLAGLRRFRDQALKSAPGGRQLINAYYRNSPEVATLLLCDDDLRRDALRIIQHFAGVGDALARHGAEGRFIEASEPVIPPAIRDAVMKLTRALADRGSPELQRDLSELGDVLNKATGLSLEALRQKVEAAKRKRAPDGFLRLEQHQLNPASREAAKTPELRRRLTPETLAPGSRESARAHDAP